MPHQILATYTFLPWMKQGISLSVTEKDTLTGASPDSNERAAVTVNIQLNDNSAMTVSRQVKLIGPGDIIGINEKAIIRAEPAKGTPDFEDNYLPYIEFYDEDFPWRFTPAIADTTIEDGKRLRPWLFLAVLKKTEYTFDPNPGGALPLVTIVDSSGNPSGTTADALFPDPSHSWAWAHVHVNDDLHAAASVKDRFAELAKDNPDFVISRLLSPRRLDPDTSYEAFLIPAFETGRRAGIDPSADLSAVKVLAPSYGSGQHVFPVYYRWDFQTGPTGDFESMLRRLMPRTLPSTVGVRKMDVRKPGGPLDNITFTTDFVGLGGALKVTNTLTYDWDSNADKAIFQNKLKEYLNLDYDNQTGGASADPVISPPLYGRWHAMRHAINTAADAIPNSPPWMNELNLHPEYRVPAGLGADVIRKHQEELMDYAWEQVGDVIEANKKLYQAQLAKEAGVSLHQRHLSNMSSDAVMKITEPVQRKILTDETTAPKTVFQKIKNSNLPLASQNAVFRRIARPEGFIAKRLRMQAPLQPQPLATNLLTNLNDTTLTSVTAAVPSPSPSEFLTTTEVQLASQEIQELESAPSNTATYRATTSSTGQVVPNNVFSDVRVYYNSLLPAASSPIAVSSTASHVVNKIRPSATVPKRAYSRLNFQAAMDPADKTTIVPVMAAPRFPQPMYEHLRDLSPDFIIPNVDNIPNNTITALLTNPHFIESYMVGLNYEMGRELLWREYPTDQRGTYFKQFWDVRDYVNTDPSLTAQQLEQKLSDIRPIHEWPIDSALGVPSHRHSTTSEPQVVLLIRGDLLRKYPDTVIYAQRAGTRPNATSPRQVDETNTKFPLFRAVIGNDITFFGFDLTATQAKGTGTGTDQGWYFIIQERPGQTRFGADLGSGNTTSYKDLHWGNIPRDGDNIDPDASLITFTSGAAATDPDYPVAWETNSADMAYILYQLPVVMAIHASKMLGQLNP